jgi:hypothetical protein
LGNARELVEGARERLAVACLDGGFDVTDRRHGGRLDHLADRHLLVDRDALGDVLEQFLEFVGLIVRKLPVARVAGEPELRVMALNQHHEFDEARLIGLRRLADGAAGCADKGEAG